MPVRTDAEMLSLLKALYDSLQRWSQTIADARSTTYNFMGAIEYDISTAKASLEEDYALVMRQESPNEQLLMQLRKEIQELDSAARQYKDAAFKVQAQLSDDTSFSAATSVSRLEEALRAYIETKLTASTNNSFSSSTSGTKSGGGETADVIVEYREVDDNEPPDNPPDDDDPPPYRKKYFKSWNEGTASSGKHR